MQIIEGVTKVNVVADLQAQRFDTVRRQVGKCAGILLQRLLLSLMHWLKLDPAGQNPVPRFTQRK